MWQDVKFAFRSWRQRKALTAALIGMLAIGIAATTSVFALAYAELWRPSPLPHPEQLVGFVAALPHGSFPVPAAHYLALQQAPGFAQVAALGFDERMLHDGPSAKVEDLGLATANLLPALELPLTLGRNFTPGEMQAGHDNVALISNAFWQSHFAGSPSVLGQSLRLDDRFYTIVGVLPRRLDETDFGGTDIWIPEVITATDLTFGAYLQTIGRLRTGLSWAAVKPQFDAYVAGLHLQFRHQPLAIRTFDLAQVQGKAVGRSMLLALLAAVALLLLIACANVAGLLLARSVGRQREMAVRQALGATRARIVRQLLTEGFLLAVAACGAGMLLADWITAALRASSLTHMLYHLDTARLDPMVLLIAVAASGFCAVLLSLAPALRSAHPKQVSLTGMTATSGSTRLRAMLVALEIALCLPLLVGAGLMGTSLARLSSVATGLDPAHLAEFEFSITPQQIKHPEEIAALAPKVLAAARDAIGPSHVALVGQPPFDRYESKAYTLAPSPAILRDNQTVVGVNYFATVRQRVMFGRAFDDHDTESAPGVVIVNQSWVRQFSPHNSPLGLELRWGKNGAESHHIVGVVADLRDQNPRYVPSPELYLPYAQTRTTDLGLVIRANNPSAAVGFVRQRLAQAMPDLAIGSAEPLTALLRDDIALPRTQSWLVMVFAAVAGLFALAGIWAMVAFAVQQRQREFGIRIALGAGSGDILRQAMRQIAIWSAGGIAAGLFAAWAASRLIASMLFEVPATDPVVYALVAAGFAVAALAAAYAPARRALDADPLATLRCE